jgi:glycine C-acetyltransferase
MMIFHPPLRECLAGAPFTEHYHGQNGGSASREGLLDTPNARRWFDLIEWGCRNDLYTCQQPLEVKSGPATRLRGERFLMISSYDYLGLIGNPAIESASIDAIRRYGTGTGGVRLLTGTTDLHVAFEAELAAFKGTEASITFSSGYLANLAIISSLLGPHDRVILDSKVHRSTTDACRLARVCVETFRHNDSASLREVLEKKGTECRTLIVVEGIYSMDGDICPLPDIVELKRKFGAYLMVDEAHSFGVLGSTGRGVDEYFGIRPGEIDIWMGSLSKAIPANGGFVAGSRELIVYLQHGAAPFMFSAALCPAAVGAALESLRVLRREPQRLTLLRHNADFLRSRLIELGYDTGQSASPVIPIIMGDEEATCRLSRELFEMGILASAVLFPAVPSGASRLRLCATAAQDKFFFEEVLQGFRKARSKDCRSLKEAW